MSQFKLDKFVYDQNLLLIRSVLAKTTDETERRHVQGLLDIEEAKSAPTQEFTA